MADQTLSNTPAQGVNQHAGAFNSRSQPNKPLRHRQLDRSPVRFDDSSSLRNVASLAGLYTQYMSL
jgi:hypothetical protein